MVESMQRNGSLNCISSEKWLATPYRMRYQIEGRNHNFIPERFVICQPVFRKLPLFSREKLLRYIEISTSLQWRDFHSISRNLYKFRWTKSIWFYITFLNLNRTGITIYCRVAWGRSPKWKMVFHVIQLLVCDNSRTEPTPDRNMCREHVILITRLSVRWRTWCEVKNCDVT
jgi:hypothetical protein